MKRKILSMALAASCVLSLTACGGAAAGDKNNASSAQGSGNELAMITDVGSIDDKSFNQATWEGVEQFAKEQKIADKYYKPTEQSTEAINAAIDLAIKGGAKMIACPGFLFEDPIAQAQDKYPDVDFIIADSAPTGGVVKDNTLALFFAEQEAGYLAGYAAVYDGYKNMGFMGGMAVPAVERYGYGFIQGADAAAKALGIKDVTIKYTYMGNFDATPENMAKASAWYNDGTEVIFACAGSGGNSVMKAAETTNKKVIGVDVDQSSESPTVITSAMKNLQKAVYDALGEWKEGKFPGGKSLTLDSTSQGVELPMETSRFTKFNEAEYEKVYASLPGLTLATDQTAKDAKAVPVEAVKVDVID